MEGEAVERKLYNAASEGDVTTLVQLLEEDPYLVHGVSFPCSRNLLHVAAAGGHVGIASKLLAVAPEMCWRRDDQGMNPVHVAAMNGHVEILERLLEASTFPAMERLHRGQTVLHLCVKHAQLRVMKVLVEKLGDLVCTKDDDGDTLLHLAVRCDQLETIQHLVEKKVLELSTRNGMGKTAVQILDESHRSSVNYLEMKKLLTDPSLFGVEFSKAIPEMSNTIVVVAVLIATMAFQSAINPPGGVWSADDNKASHKAGKAVMASTYPDTYIKIMTANGAAFACSLMAIFPLSTKIRNAIYPYCYLAIFLICICTSMTAILVTFLQSIKGITPDDEVMKSKLKNIDMIMTVLGILTLIPEIIAFLWDIVPYLNKKMRQV